MEPHGARPRPAPVPSNISLIPRTLRFAATALSACGIVSRETLWGGLARCSVASQQLQDAVCDFLQLLSGDGWDGFGDGLDGQLCVFLVSEDSLVSIGWFTCDLVDEELCGFELCSVDGSGVMFDLCLAVGAGVEGGECGCFCDGSECFLCEDGCLCAFEECFTDVVLVEFEVLCGGCG